MAAMERVENDCHRRVRVESGPWRLSLDRPLSVFKSQWPGCCARFRLNARCRLSAAVGQPKLLAPYRSSEAGGVCRQCGVDFKSRCNRSRAISCRWRRAASGRLDTARPDLLLHLVTVMPGLKARRAASRPSCSIVWRSPKPPDLGSLPSKGNQSWPNRDTVQKNGVSE